MKKKLVSWISKANKALIQIETAIMVVSLVIILFLFAATILLRMVFKSDFPGMEEIVMALSVWMYMMGCAIACHTESHVSADLIKTIIKKRKPRLIHRIWMYSFNTFIGVYFTILSPVDFLPDAAEAGFYCVEIPAVDSLSVGSVWIYFFFDLLCCPFAVGHLLSGHRAWRWRCKCTGCKYIRKEIISAVENLLHI